MKDQLVGGIRFIDLRVVWTKGPHGDDESWDWYVLHILESAHRVKYHLEALANFLEEYPFEVVVLRMTYHSSNCGNYPGAGPEQLGVLWNQTVIPILGPLLINPKETPMNVTTFSQLWSINKRVYLLAADWEIMSGGGPDAPGMSACKGLYTWQPPEGVRTEEKTQKTQISQVREGARVRAQMKAQNVLWSTFWSTSTPLVQLGSMASLAIFPDMPVAKKKDILLACAASFEIPGNLYCPENLLNVTSLSNYYLQRILDWSLQESVVFLPHVVYTDHILAGGMMRTSPSAAYAFAPAIILKGLLQGGFKCGAPCKSLAALVAQNNVTLVDEPRLGRLKDWPTLPQQ